MVDFAYHVHTDVGNQMFAAKINGNVVHAGHALANAEVVEVLTYDGAPSRGSLARHQVLRFLAYPIAMCSVVCAPPLPGCACMAVAAGGCPVRGACATDSRAHTPAFCSCCNRMASAQQANDKHSFCRSGRATRARRRHATSSQSS